MRKKFKISCFLVFLLLTITTLVKAETLKGGYPACLTEDLFDQFIQALVRKDERGMQYLLENGCIGTKTMAGISVSVLDTTWTGKAKVRAYVGDDALILWTNTESINR